MKIFILFLFLISTAHGANPFKYIWKEINQKNYAYALVKLKKIKGTQKVMDRRYFLEAICLTNLGDPKKSYAALKKIKSQFKGVDYELGRALYFYGNINKSREHFQYSINENYKIAKSYHFLGKSFVKKEEFREAKKYFQHILKASDATNWILQDAYYQIGSSHLEIAKRELSPEDMGSIIKKHVLPYLKKSLQISPDSKVAKRARKKIYLVKTKYEID